MTYIGIRQRESRPQEPKGSDREVGESEEKKTRRKGEERRLEVDCGDFTFAVFFFSLSDKSDKERREEGGDETQMSESPCGLLCVQTKTKWQR